MDDVTTTTLEVPTPPRTYARRLAHLTLDDVVALASAYRRWNGVLAAALDAVPRDAVAQLRSETGNIRAAVAAAGAGLDDDTLEDAKMAVWLYALAEVAGEDSHTLALLREPWHAAIIPAIGDAA